MFGKRRNSIPNPVAPDFASYHQQPMPTPGASEFVFDKLYAYPLQYIGGGGVLSMSQFASLQPAQLTAQLAVPMSPIWGAGVPSGSTQLEPLLQMDTSGDNGKVNQ